MFEKLKYQVALTLIPGVGPVTARNLISYCGSIEGVFKEKELKLLKIPEVGPVTAKTIANHDVFEQAERECLFMEQHKIKALFYLDKDYPQRLSHCNDAPLLLYFKGEADLNAERIVAVVGTRNATEYGMTVTESIVTELGRIGVMIISGLAYGIDVCAHKTAVKNNIPNIGVVGHGLDRLYPANHSSVAAKMMKNGGILTEFPSNTNPDRENFPARNRIVAGMCDAVLVVESAEKGGALITADIANSYNRDVFAIPGNVNNIYSKGCNQFIRENRAALTESADDIIRMMGWDNTGNGAQKNVQRTLFADLNEEQEKLVNALQERPALELDDLSWKLQSTPGKTAALLLELELKGIVKVLPGKRFQLL